MFKPPKKIKRFSEITTIIILSIVAVTSFVIAQKIGNQTQELRSQAYVLPALVPPSCSATKLALCSSFGKGCMKISNTEICIIIKPVNSTISCQKYTDLVQNQYCDPNKFINQDLFKGIVTCDGGSFKETNKKGCKLYCDKSSWKVKEDYCDWIPAGVNTADITQYASVTNTVNNIVNTTIFTWSFCPTNYRSAFLSVLNNVKTGILPKKSIEFRCFVDSAAHGDYDPLASVIWFRCNTTDFNNKICHSVFVHELVHPWQYENNDTPTKEFSNKIGCIKDSTGKYIFTEVPFKDAISEWGRTNCTEALAEAIRFYVYPYKAGTTCLLNDPIKDYKNLLPKTYDFVKNNVFNGKIFFEIFNFQSNS